MDPGQGAHLGARPLGARRGGQQDTGAWTSGGGVFHECPGRGDHGDRAVTCPGEQPPGRIAEVGLPGDDQGPGAHEGQDRIEEGPADLGRDTRWSLLGHRRRVRVPHMGEQPTYP